MRISDWSSDVCSSDLRNARIGAAEADDTGRTARSGAAALSRGDRHRFAAAAIGQAIGGDRRAFGRPGAHGHIDRSEEHTSELQSLMRISYAVFCLKKKITIKDNKKMRNNKTSI